MKRVYLDHNASSPMPARVSARLAAALALPGGNPSSPHSEGQAARHTLEEARDEVAAFARAQPAEVVFTSGGTESNNAAVRGVVAGASRGGRPGTRHVVTSCSEHPSILEACRALQGEGVEVTFLGVDARGLVDPEDLRRTLRFRGADLVSIHHGNNETGVVQPVEDLARIAREAGVAFHTDMAQTAGRIPGNAVAPEASLMTLASHKAGGPVGVGALIIREGTPFEPMLRGGAQEGRRRPGTEAVALAAAFAEALQLRSAILPSEAVRQEVLRDRIETALEEIVPRCRIHALGAPRLPNTTNFYLPGAPGRMLVMQLDRLGFAVSTGSACSTGSSRPSHVLAAMGCPPEEALDSLRVSLGPENSMEDVTDFLAALARSVGLATGAAITGAAPGGGTR